MGKVERPKKAGAASSSPYDRKSSTAKSSSATKNNVFKFNKDFGQHILKNPGVADGMSCADIVDREYGVDLHIAIQL